MRSLDATWWRSYANRIFRRAAAGLDRYEMPQYSL
jgi:hypothetical protein